MNANEIVTLALLGLKASIDLVAALKAQHGLTDEQLLDLASKTDADTVAAAQAFIASLSK